MSADPGCYRLPLERYPGMNRFVLDWLAGDERFLPRHDGLVGTAALGHPAAGASPAAPPLVDALIASNRRWGLDVEPQIRRWAASKTFTIAAGQQTGFAGGPLYTLVKLASLLKMKREREASGTPTTLFFWLATEDHDFNEATTIALPRRDSHGQGDLMWLRASRPPDSREVVGRTVIPESLIEQLIATLATERPAWLRRGITFGESFAELLASTSGGDIVLVDSLLPELRRAGAPLFASIANRWDEVQAALSTRSAELESAGYAPQIVPRDDDGYTLLYRIDAAGSRDLLQKPASVGSPESISTSAITRPLLQDFVLRPDVFVGGPSEVAYYAQIAPLHAMLDVWMPRVALRGHVLIAPRRIIRYFSRFDIEPHEVFTTPERVVAAHAAEGVIEVRSIADQAQRELLAHIEKIRALALPADHAVARAVNRSIGHIEYHFKKLTERAIRGLVRKDKERFHAARELVSTFFPDRHVQDRVVAWFPYWREYGRLLLDRIVDEVEPDEPAFKIVSL